MITPPLLTPGLSPDILPTIDGLENGSNPFAAPVPDDRIKGPKLPPQDFGRMRADEGAGELAISQSGALEADNRSGMLARP